jgi:hypothetical protein
MIFSGFSLSVLFFMSVRNPILVTRGLIRFKFVAFSIFLERSFLIVVMGRIVKKVFKFYYGFMPKLIASFSKLRPFS